MPESSVVVANDLTRSFGPNAGVFDLDLDLERGLVVGLIGPSGSGKTTTVRLLTGIFRPDSGTVRVFGEDPLDFSRQTRERIGYLPQHTALYPDLTLRENLRFAASLYGMSGRRRSEMERMVEFLELAEVMDNLPRQASGGEKRRLSLAAALIHQPELIFLDEPTAGLDPMLRSKLWDRFDELSSAGRTLLVTTQYVGEAAYCDLVAVMAGGRVLALETPEDLRRLAFEGEVLDVVFAEPPDPSTADSIADLTDRRPEWLDRRTVRIVVNDAGSAGPTIVRWAQARGLELEETESYLPPFDDVFVEVVTRLSDFERGEHEE